MAYNKSFLDKVKVWWHGTLESSGDVGSRVFVLDHPKRGKTMYYESEFKKALSEDYVGTKQATYKEIAFLGEAIGFKVERGVITELPPYLLEFITEGGSYKCKEAGISIKRTAVGDLTVSYGGLAKALKEGKVCNNMLDAIVNAAKAPCGRELLASKEEISKLTIVSCKQAEDAHVKRLVAASRSEMVARRNVMLDWHNYVREVDGLDR